MEQATKNTGARHRQRYAFIKKRKIYNHPPLLYKKAPYLLKVQSAIKPDEGVVPLPLNSHLNPLPGSFASQ